MQLSSHKYQLNIHVLLQIIILFVKPTQVGIRQLQTSGGTPAIVILTYIDITQTALKNHVTSRPLSALPLVGVLAS
jgi:hypothetical protein